MVWGKFRAGNFVVKGGDKFNSERQKFEREWRQFHVFWSFFWGDIKARMSVRSQEKMKVRSSIKKTLLPRDLAKIGFKIKGSKTIRKTTKLGKSNPNI